SSFYSVCIFPPSRSPLFPSTTALPIFSAGLAFLHAVGRLHADQVGGICPCLPRCRGLRLYRELRLLRERLDQDRLPRGPADLPADRKSTRLNSSHVKISYAVYCLRRKR